MDLICFKKWNNIEQLTPFNGKNNYKEITVGERVKYRNISCWSFINRPKPLNGTITGMDEGLYILKLDEGNEIKANRNQIELFPLTYQTIKNSIK